mmetsp:Transcript_134211/g.189643  ORF Transcript_134211/g.189643 Transcript_134211/m.189643 type:complete len:225 (+) Transcript_134211:567-1241(+)
MVATATSSLSPLTIALTSPRSSSRVFPDTSPLLPVPTSSVLMVCSLPSLAAAPALSPTTPRLRALPPSSTNPRIPSFSRTASSTPSLLTEPGLTPPPPTPPTTSSSSCSRNPPPPPPSARLRSAFSMVFPPTLTPTATPSPSMSTRDLPSPSPSALSTALNTPPSLPTSRSTPEPTSLPSPTALPASSLLRVMSAPSPTVFPLVLVSPPSAPPSPAPSPALSAV